MHARTHGIFEMSANGIGNSRGKSSCATSLACSSRDRRKYLADFVYPFCEDVSKYEIILKIGQGTFGEVFKASDKRNPTKHVAMKKVLMNNEKEGFPITALREIQILRLLKHKNVVNLIEICRTTSNSKATCTIFLIFDFCEHDLAGLLSNLSVKFSLGEVKEVMKQLLEGLFFIHTNKILHRDLKAANILITKSGELKLADFGLSRPFSSTTFGDRNRFTNRVVTLWYRPPELLLGDRYYGPPIDLWGAGCIMAEMWTRCPIMQGSTEQHQLKLISRLCGSITPEVWPEVENLEFYKSMQLPRGDRRRVKELLMRYVQDISACDLLDKLLILNPARRINANDALMHDFFWIDPMPSDLSKMLARHDRSMFEFLAPRKPGQKPVPQKSVVQPTSTAKPLMETGYHDRIF